MSRLIISVAILGLCLLACEAHTQNYRLVKGLYVHYEDGEYENAFIQCSSVDVWQVVNEDAIRFFKRLYESSQPTLYGELFVEAEGLFKPIDKIRFQNSHYAGDVQLKNITGYSVDSKIIENCRVETKQSGSDPDLSPQTSLTLMRFAIM